MSTDGDNIVRGRIRRYSSVHGRILNPCGPKIINVDKEFPAGLRVKHKITQRTGTVQSEFGGPPSCYDPWEVPVQWDGDKYASGENYESLIKI